MVLLSTKKRYVNSIHKILLILFEFLGKLKEKIFMQSL